MDNIEILVKAGRGGNGLVSFWHEKFQPFGGPDGGDGGKGGDIYLLADINTRDLTHFRHARSFHAGEGAGGGKQKKHGKNGEDNIIKVPVGTSVYKVENVEKAFVADMDYDKKKVRVAEGGRGGLGNIHFATATHQVPRKATPGREGETVTLLLEYTIPADVAIVGMPNSGKSSLLEKITGVPVKIADYPFTTVETVPGSKEIENRMITIVEIPALIEGSHNGKGLGNRALRHCSRADLILVLLDGSADDAAKDKAILLKELKYFDEKLMNKKIITVVTKVDLPGVKEKIPGLKRRATLKAHKLHCISATTGEGVQELVDDVVSTLKEKKVETSPGAEKEVVFRPKPMGRKEIL